MDSVPLTHADGICASIGDWRKGTCTAHSVTVDIPFAIAATSYTIVTFSSMRTAA